MISNKKVRGLFTLGVRVSNRIDQAAIVCCAMLIITMLISSLVGIIYQVLFDEALVWSTSLTRLFLPWVAMLSISVAFKSGEHIALHLLLDYLPSSITNALLTVNLLAVGVFGGALVCYGIEFFEFSTQYFMVSETLQISHRWTAAAIPVGGAIICCHLLSGFALIDQKNLADEACYDAN